MMSRVIVSTILVVFAVTSNTIAFPQIGLNPDNISQVNGFVFDGPINTVPIRTTTRRSVDRVPVITSTQRPVNNGVTAPATTTRATPAPVTTGSQVYENCIASCLATAEYNPVCGTDNITYDNPGRLNCAEFCGKNIQISSYGRCGADGLRG